MEILHNNQLSEYLIINFKINTLSTDIINIDVINNYYLSITEWIKYILDKYNNKKNWKFYICNLNFKVIRVFITIDKQIYARMDNETHSIYTSNYSIDTNNTNIELDYLIYLFHIHEFELILKYKAVFYNILSNEDQILENNFNSESDSKTDSDSESQHTYNSSYFYNDSIQSEDQDDSISIKSDTNSEINSEYIESNIKIVEYNNNTLIKHIGISGVSKDTFISELKKIPFIKNTYYNAEFITDNIFHEDLFHKMYENNNLFWITSNNNIILYNQTNIENNKLLYKFTNQL